jgi:hypothetical protein
MSYVALRRAGPCERSVLSLFAAVLFSVVTVSCASPAASESDSDKARRRDDGAQADDEPADEAASDDEQDPSEGRAKDAGESAGRDAGKAAGKDAGKDAGKAGRAAPSRRIASTRDTFTRSDSARAV